MGPFFSLWTWVFECVAWHFRDPGVSMAKLIMQSPGGQWKAWMWALWDFTFIKGWDDTEVACPGLGIDLLCARITWERMLQLQMLRSLASGGTYYKNASVFSFSVAPQHCLDDIIFKVFCFTVGHPGFSFSFVSFMTWVLKLSQQLVELFTNLCAWLLLIFMNPKIRGSGWTGECPRMLSLGLGIGSPIKDTVIFLVF